MSTENNEDNKEMNKNKPKTNNKMETFGLYLEFLISIGNFCLPGPT